MSQWILSIFKKLWWFSVLQKLRAACLDNGWSSKLSGKVESERIFAARCSQSDVALCMVQSAVKVPYGKTTNWPLFVQLLKYFFTNFHKICSEVSISLIGSLFNGSSGSLRNFLIIFPVSSQTKFFSKYFSYFTPFGWNTSDKMDSENQFLVIRVFGKIIFQYI